MIDTATRKPIKIEDGGTSGPYLTVPKDQLEQVRKLLRANDIPHWADHLAISFDGRPPVVVIYLGKKVDPRRVQALLDAA